MQKKEYKGLRLTVRLKDGTFEDAICVEDIKTSILPEVIVKLRSGVKCHAYWDESDGIFDADNVFGVCDSKVYTFTIKQGANMKKVDINASSYKEALKKVRDKAKKLKFKGNKVSSKFDSNKLDTRDF